jgi:hypothetical protein
MAKSVAGACLRRGLEGPIGLAIQPSVVKNTRIGWDQTGRSPWRRKSLDRGRHDKILEQEDHRDEEDQDPRPRGRATPPAASDRLTRCPTTRGPRSIPPTWRCTASRPSDNWGGAARLLEMIAAARRRGLSVDCDAYPYDTATNPLRNLVPRWVMDGSIPAMFERLGRADVRARLRANIARDGLRNFGRIPVWDVVRLAVSPHLPRRRWGCGTAACCARVSGPTSPSSTPIASRPGDLRRAAPLRGWRLHGRRQRRDRDRRRRPDRRDARPYLAAGVSGAHRCANSERLGLSCPASGA